MNKIIKLNLRFFIVFSIIILFQTNIKPAMADNCSSTYTGYSCVNINLIDNMDNYLCYAGFCDSEDILCCELNSDVSTQLASSNAPQQTSGPVSLTNPLGGSESNKAGVTDIPTILGKIINSVLGIIGSLALVMFIYGGASWMLSGGNQEQVTKGKNIIIWAAIGIVIIFISYALVKFVLTTVAGA